MTRGKHRTDLVGRGKLVHPITVSHPIFLLYSWYLLTRPPLSLSLRFIPEPSFYRYLCQRYRTNRPGGLDPSSVLKKLKKIYTERKSKTEATIEIVISRIPTGYYEIRKVGNVFAEIASRKVLAIPLIF